MKKALAAIAAAAVLALAAPASAGPPIIGPGKVCFYLNGKPHCLVLPHGSKYPTLPIAKDSREGPWQS